MECVLHGVVADSGVETLMTMLEGLAGSPPQPVDVFTVAMRSTPPEGVAKPILSDVTLAREKGCWSVCHKTKAMTGAQAEKFCAAAREHLAVNVTSGDPREMFRLIGFTTRFQSLHRGHRYCIPRAPHVITASLKQIYQADAEGTPAAAPVSPGHWLVEVSAEGRTADMESLMQTLDVLRRQLEHMVMLQKPHVPALVRPPTGRPSAGGSKGKGADGRPGEAPPPAEEAAAPQFRIVFA